MKDLGPAATSIRVLLGLLRGALASPTRGGLGSLVTRAAILGALASVLAVPLAICTAIHVGKQALLVAAGAIRQHL